MLIKRWQCKDWRMHISNLKILHLSTFILNEFYVDHKRHKYAKRGLNTTVYFIFEEFIHYIQSNQGLFETSLMHNQALVFIVSHIMRQANICELSYIKKINLIEKWINWHLIE